MPPPPRNLARRVLALLTLVAYGTLARAGQFALDGGTPTGGTVVGFTPPPPSTSGPPKYVYSGGWYSASPNCPFSAPTVASCAGKLHWAWTWSGPEAAPTTVVLKVESSAGWNGHPGGSCADGFGDTPVYTHANPNDPNTPIVSGNVSGVRYVVRAVSNNKVDYDVEPSSMCPSSTGCGAASRVTLTPLRLVLGGVRDPDTDKRLLIGQRLTAQVTGAPAGANTYTWTVGGGPFSSYTPSTPSQFAGYDPPSASTDPSTACCFRSQGSKGIQCSVYVAAAGQTVTLSDNVTAVAPPYTARMIVGHGSINSNPNLALRLWDAVYTDPNGDDNVAGAWMIGWVTTPVDFRASGPGQWGWYQIVTQTQNEVRAVDGSYAKGREDSTPPALDGTAPYLNLFFDANGVEKVTSDSPEVPVNDIDGYDYVLSKSFFKLYQMYTPPGSGSVPVPLANLSWNWYAKAYRDNVNHVWNQPLPGDFSQAWYYVGDFPSHPMWTRAITSNPLVPQP